MTDTANLEIRLMNVERAVNKSQDTYEKHSERLASIEAQLKISIALTSSMVVMMFGIAMKLFKVF